MKGGETMGHYPLELDEEPTCPYCQTQLTHIDALDNSNYNPTDGTSLFDYECPKCNGKFTALSKI